MYFGNWSHSNTSNSSQGHDFFKENLSPVPNHPQTNNPLCKSPPFSVLYYFNARSLLPKLDELTAVCLTHQPNVICIAKSWIDETIPDEEICLKNYFPIRLDCDKHGSDILLYVLNCLSHSVVFSGSVDLELIVMIFVQSGLLSLFFFYRPPI